MSPDSSSAAAAPSPAAPSRSVATKRFLVAWPEYMGSAARELATARGESVTSVVRGAVRRELEQAGFELPG